MIKCFKCGNYNSDDDLFCVQCGSRLVVADSNTNSSDKYENNPFADKNTISKQTYNNPFGDDDHKQKQFNDPFSENVSAQKKASSAKNTTSNNNKTNTSTTSSRSTTTQNQNTTGVGSKTATASNTTRTTYTPTNPGLSDKTIRILVFIAVGFFGILFVYSFCFVLIRSAISSVRQIEVGKSSEKLLQMKNYQEAESYLQSQGFNNIQAIGEGDIKYGVDYENGEIIEISIDGDESFDKDDEFTQNSPIVIYYHSAADIEVKSYTSYVGENYMDVVEDLNDAGFYNIEIEEDPDLIIGLLNSEGEVESIEIDGSSYFLDGNEYPADAKIVITIHTFPD